MSAFGEASTSRGAAQNIPNGENGDDNDENHEDALIIKGDAVGNTVYSSTWIINTLISLADIKNHGWTEEFEKELCVLWDMSSEKDVVNFLVGNEFIPIAEYILYASTQPRLTEIVLGILGNACCYNTALQMVGRSGVLTERILTLLSSDDAELLTQIVRILQLAIWDIKTDPNSVWWPIIKGCPFFSEALMYILNNSTNTELLIYTTDLLYTISETNLLDNAFLLKELFDLEKLLPALLESFLQIIPDRKCYFIEKDLMLIENWLAIMISIRKTKLSKIDDTNEQCSSKIPVVLHRILQPYQHVYNLIPVDERAAMCIHEAIELMMWFERIGVYVGPQFNCILASMIHVLLSEEVQNNPESDPDCVLDDLADYLKRYWIRIFNMLSVEQIIEIMGSCKKETVNTIIQILEAQLQLSSAKQKKLREIKEFLEII